MDDKCCGTCKYHKRQGTDWVCVCQTSEMYADYTDYECVCDEHEGRGENQS